MTTPPMYAVQVYSRSHGYIRAQDGATKGATLGVNVYNPDGSLLELSPSAVTSVFGRTGVVTAQTGDYTKAQVGLGNVDNTSDAAKPVSTAQAAAIALKVDKAGDTMTGQLAATGLVVNPGGTYTTGSLYTDTNYGMILRGRQPGAVAAFAFHNSANAELMKITDAGVMTVGGNAVHHAGNFDPGTKASATHQNLRSSLNTGALTITDWNSATENGWYMANSAANAPVVGPWYIGIVTQHNPSWVTQELWDFTAGAGTVRYRRQMSNGVWGAWTSNLRFSPDVETGVWAGNAAYSGVINGNGNFVLITAAEATDPVTYLTSAHAGGSVKIRAGANDSANELAITSAGVVANTTIQGVSLTCASAGTAYFNGNGSGIQMNGLMYENGTTYNLAANGAAWVRNPRHFVQSTDPGAQAQDGDLWFW